MILQSVAPSEDPVAPGGRVPPHSQDAERSVLGACMLSRSAIREVAEEVGAADFYRPRHAKIFEAVLDLEDRGEPVDLVTLTDALEKEGSLEKVGGIEYLTGLCSGVATAAGARHWARIVKRKALLRSLIGVADKASAQAYTEEEDLEAILDQTEAGIFSLMQSRSAVPYHTIKPIIAETFEQIEKVYDHKEMLTGVPSGFKDLDTMTCGFQKSDLIILAARPSMGKTAFCLNVVANAAMHAEPRVPSLIFSLEMSRHQLAMRMLCSEARVEGRKIRTGYLDETDWPNLTMAAGLISESSILIDDTPGLTLPQVRSKARQAKSEHGIGLIVIDYLQLMEAGREVENRVQEISIISRALKSIARELEVPVIALSQLSRNVESRPDKRPMLSDLRESGAIEQDADVVLFLYRDEYYNRDSTDRGIAEVIIGKQRNGPVGSVKLKFFEQHTAFKDLARDG